MKPTPPPPPVGRARTLVDHDRHHLPCSGPGHVRCPPGRGRNGPGASGTAQTERVAPVRLVPAADVLGPVTPSSTDRAAAERRYSAERQPAAAVPRARLLPRLRDRPPARAAGPARLR